MENKLEIYTDGSCLNNPGRGGVGIILKYNNHTKNISEGYTLTTNNRMELLAVIIALEHIQDISKPTVIYSDSKYVVDSVEKKWLNSWVKKDFKGRKNKDLWIRFLKIYNNFENITFTWVKGHADNKFNNACDKLALAAAHSNNLKTDEGYEPNS